MHNMTCRTIFLALVLAALAGCGKSGPKRYDLSGNVTYDGKPVPVGNIIFTPDSTKGNAGPGCGADIRDGHYSTEAGLGTISGPHEVRITGYDGKSTGAGDAWGRPLFPEFRTSVDLPKEPGTQDFAIPGNANPAKPSNRKSGM